MATAANRRLSPSPPLAQQPLSKRDKKRHQVETRIKDIEAGFLKERDFHLRNHLGGVNRDIHYVNRANPYANRPLEDFLDDAFSDVVSQPSVAGSIDGEATRAPLGKFSQQFVDDVNDAMEERDARITESHTKFHKKMDAHRLDFFFALEAAEAEHKALVATMKERMINHIESKKRQLKKEKEMLDAADYSTLAHNGLTLIQPSSPGGAHTHRRTRNTRRQDFDVLETGEGGRKKRKTLADPEISSPNPNGSRSRQDLLASALWDKQDSSASSTSASEVKVERFFTTRELNNHTKRAREEVATNWLNKARPRHTVVNGHTIRVNGDAHGDGGMVNGADDSDDMDDEMNQSLLVAPAMDRTGSSHATRSTRALFNAAETVTVHLPPVEIAQLANQPLSQEDAKKNYGSAILAAQAQRAGLKDTNKDLEVPYTQGMSASEQVEDWQYISSL